MKTITNLRTIALATMGITVGLLVRGSAGRETAERETPVANQVQGPPTFDESISRSFTVLNRTGSTLVFDEAISRSFTVLNRTGSVPVFDEAISRAFTACNSSEFVDDDGDGVHDCLDLCHGFDDNLDADADGIPDDCDICPADPGPAIDVHPGSTVACHDTAVMFTVMASGSPVLSYQWRKDGFAIVGATGSMYTIDPVMPADEGLYDVVVTNDCGLATSDPAMLQVTLCQLHGDVFPLGPPPGNCLVDIDDLLVMLAAFAAADQCAFCSHCNLFPCGQPCGDGVVDIDDIISVLNAFSGEYDCAHPCPR